MARSVWLLINAVLFQLGWLLCVLLRNDWATLFAILVVVFHFYLTPLRKQDCIFLACLLVVGMVQESLALKLGVYRLTEGAEYRLVAGVPLWLLLLWMLFALTLNHSLQWMVRTPWLACVGGILVAPLSYLAGDRLGVITLADGGVVWLGLLWGVSMLGIAGLYLMLKRLPFENHADSQGGIS